jgi:recombination protein RecA
MAKRERVVEKKSSYFADEKTHYEFVSSGCTLIDCVLGGGYPLGRISNIIGDKSTAKTGLATEAVVNFMRKYPKGIAAYRDTEAAFDKQYAKAMGMPIEDIDFGKEHIQTVEQFADDFDSFLSRCVKNDAPGFYVVDSLDALSDTDEMERDIGKGTFGTAKAKLLGLFFRTRVHKIEQSRAHLMVVSQVRDNIGAMFGEKHKRSGGHALDFYASQFLWLSHLETLTKEINKIKRPYGIDIKARAKKNKIGLPFRDARFTFRFGYGVEDVEACAEWLKEIGRLKEIEVNQSDFKEYLGELGDMSSEEYQKEQESVSKVVKRIWAEIEVSFLPTRKKYA